jgi:hypothetical protein
VRISNARLEGAAWGIFVIMGGACWLVPSDRLPQRFWFIGTGLILLGLNAARYMTHLPVSEVNVGLGLALLLGGLVDHSGGPSPALPIFVILSGVVLLVRNLVRRTRKGWDTSDRDNI